MVNSTKMQMHDTSATNPVSPHKIARCIVVGFRKRLSRAATANLGKAKDIIPKAKLI